MIDYNARGMRDARIGLAKDVLARLEARKAVVAIGKYLALPECSIPAFLSLYEDDGDEQLAETFNRFFSLSACVDIGYGEVPTNKPAGQQCEACALGNMFLSAVEKTHLSSDDIHFEDWEYLIFAELEKFFPSLDLLAIESYFEGFVSSSGISRIRRIPYGTLEGEPTVAIRTTDGGEVCRVNREALITLLEGVVAYDRDAVLGSDKENIHEFSATRLRNICENIIRNDGNYNLFDN